eukprot:scpid92908/ scgid1793/ 
MHQLTKDTQSSFSHLSSATIADTENVQTSDSHNRTPLKIVSLKMRSKHSEGCHAPTHLCSELKYLPKPTVVVAHSATERNPIAWWCGGVVVTVKSVLVDTPAPGLGLHKAR